MSALLDSGAEVSVAGMPRPVVRESQGRRYWVTQRSRAPHDAPWDSIQLNLFSLPLPGPWREYAVGLVCMLVFCAVFADVYARRLRRFSVSDTLQQRQLALLQEMHQLALQRERQEVGPNFWLKERTRILTSLAQVLQERSLREHAVQKEERSG